MKIFLIAALLYLNTSYAQSPVTYSKVIEINTSKDELFSRARRWFGYTFKDSKEVLIIQDKEAGELAGNGAMKFYSDTHWGSEGTKGYINYKVSILVKEGKYKYEITNFVHEGNRQNVLDLSFGLITDEVECPKHLPRQRKKWEDKLWKEIKEDISNEMTILIPSLEKAMTASNDF